MLFHRICFCCFRNRNQYLNTIPIQQKYLMLKSMYMQRLISHKPELYLPRDKSLLKKCRRAKGFGSLSSFKRVFGIMKSFESFESLRNFLLVIHPSVFGVPLSLALIIVTPYLNTNKEEN